MITPPVSDADLAEAQKALEAAATPKALGLLQRVVRADKSAFVAALVHVAILVVAALGLHLSGKDVATLGSIVTLGLSYFVSVNFNSKPKP